MDTIDYFDMISQEGFVNKNILVHFINNIMLVTHVIAFISLVITMVTVLQIPGQLQEDSSFINNDENEAATNCLQCVGVITDTMQQSYRYCRV